MPLENNTYMACLQHPLLFDHDEPSIHFGLPVQELLSLYLHLSLEHSSQASQISRSLHNSVEAVYDDDDFTMRNFGKPPDILLHLTERLHRKPDLFRILSQWRMDLITFWKYKISVVILATILTGF